jgi:hypothetical protein
MAGKTGAKKKGRAARKTRSSGKRKWSGRVTATSNAMDLEKNVFKSENPKKVAKSVKRSAEKSKRRKGTSRQSAMSMINFYINRAGKNLPAKDKKVLEKAKAELRALFEKNENR